MAMDPSGPGMNVLGDRHGLAARATGADGSGRNREAERAQLKLLAQEFEALLMNEMLGSWRDSLMSSNDDEDPDHGMGTMVDLVGSEFGRALSRSGGLGIADHLLKAFDRQWAPTSDSPPPSSEPIDSRSVNPGYAVPPVATSSVERAAHPAHDSSSPQGTLVEAVRAAQGQFEADVRPVNGKMTSAFGWRRDPINGQVKFHAGADIRMAYGAEVTSVAAGRVSFAGEQGGYGLTVVIDHSDGLQTRYAHLSSASVRVGDTVTPGQSIARAGSSGRSTGPHLHVELLSQGRPTDPSTLLKGVKGSADWKAYRSALARSAHESAIGDQE